MIGSGDDEICRVGQEMIVHVGVVNAAGVGEIRPPSSVPPLSEFPT